jgi:hypothetical protein
MPDLEYLFLKSKILRRAYVKMADVILSRFTRSALAKQADVILSRFTHTIEISSG